MNRPSGSFALDRAPISLGAALAGGAIGAGAVAGQLVVMGQPGAVVALAAALLPVLIWKRPELAPAVLLVAALTVEQFDHSAGLPAAATFSARIPLFHGIGGLHLSPADLLLVLVIAIYLAKVGSRAVGPVPRTALSAAVFALAALVVFGVVLGLSSGGVTRVALMESRPYVYLATTYVLASVLLTSRTALRAVLWGFVLAVGAKAAQGLVIFLSVRSMNPRPHAVLGHEESLFFGLFLLLAVALWLFEVRGALRTTTTLLAPLVLAADLANTRRAAWLLLAVGLVTLLAVGFVTLKGRRVFIGRLLAGLAIAAALYFPAYWNKSGGLAQPARAVRSVFAPSERDLSSDLYRYQEDQNLLYNIRQAGPLGKGFGLPIEYALPIEDISDIDAFIAYIPHNGVLYVLLRMGIAGGIAFWLMLGLGIMTACRLAKAADRELAAIGVVSTAFLFAYAFEGYIDQGFFFYRIAFVAGTILGLTEAAYRLAPKVRAVSA